MKLITAVYRRRPNEPHDNAEGMVRQRLAEKVAKEVTVTSYDGDYAARCWIVTDLEEGDGGTK